ncbi:Histidinol-phosphate aminotransferase [Bacteroidales bacterium Barb7]|nr:Histidinol-phosphate aminotransferase [Bacteroidales bacterium Barb7]
MTHIRVKDSIRRLHEDFVKRGEEDGKLIRLDRNENAFGHSKNVERALRHTSGALSSYPELYADSLLRKLADIHRISEQNIVAGNGSFELITAISQSYLNPEDEVIIPTPTFDWYKTASLLAHGHIIEVPVENHRISPDKILQAVTAKTKIIWLCNPNNPTGTVLSEVELHRFLEKLSPEILLVLDEAYIDFIRETEPVNSIHIVRTHPNVILLRTFSKVYGLASLRIGYAIGDAAVIEGIRNFKTPVSVNYLAIKAAVASLDDEAFRRSVVRQTAKQLDYLYKEFNQLGLSYIRSNTNFLTVCVGRDSDYVVNELKKKKILVRGGKDFGYPEWLRITVGKEEENQLVVTYLKGILS